MTIRRYSGPIIPGANLTNAARKDSRGRYALNNPRFQPDIAQFAIENLALAGNVPQDYAHVQAEAQQISYPASRAIATRVQMILWSVTTPVAFTVGQLMPKNLNRLSLILSNVTTPGALGGFDKQYFSFGPPPLNNIGFPGGLVLSPGVTLIWDGDSIPCDDVFIWQNSAGPLTMLGYEGIAVPEANP